MNDLNPLKSFSSYRSLFKSEVTMMILKGGILGGCAISYCIYNTTQVLLAKVGYAVAEKNPLPIIFTGMLGVAIVEGIGLTYEIGKRLLGERSFFEQISYEDMDILTSLDRCRYRVWRGIKWLEQRVEIIDITYARVFGIHTQKEIKTYAIPEYRWDLMEIIREAFKEQTQEMLNEPYPANGYTILLLNFILGATDKINQISHRIQLAKLKEKRRKAENEKAYCTLLDAWAANYTEKGVFDLPFYDKSELENNKKKLKICDVKSHLVMSPVK